MVQPVWSSRKSLRPMVPSLVLMGAMAAGLGVVALRAAQPETRVALLIGAAAVAGFAILQWLGAWVGSIASEYRIGAETVFQRTGLLSRRTAEVAIRDIRSINMSQTVWQRVLGVGDVLIGTAAQEGLEISFVGVEHPQKVVDTLNRLRQAQPGGKP